MEPNVVKEVNYLKQMIRNWRKAFSTWVEPHTDNSYAVVEFIEDIQMHMYPYLSRLEKTKYMTVQEVGEFWEYCFSQVQDLQKEIDREILFRKFRK